MRTHFLILLSIIICGNVSGQRVTQIDSVAFYKQRPKVYYDANAEYQLSASMGDDHAYQDTIIISTRDSLYKFISYTEDYNELFGLYREIPKYRNYRSIVYLSYNWLDTYYVNLTNNRVFFFYGLTCRYGNKLLSVNRNSSDRRAYIGIYKMNGDSIKELWSISPQNLDIYNIKEVYLRTKYVYICYEGLEAKYYVKIDTTFPLPSLGNIRETYVHPEAGYKECVQRMQYYPSGLPWAEAMIPSEQPYKYNGKEFVEMHGLDEYDSKARWYYPAICRTTTMDSHAERYYPTSPYAWCGNNFVRHVDLDGKDVYHYNHNTGDFSLYEETDDEYDVIGKFKYNAEIGKYEPQMQEDGSIKTYSDHLGNNDKIAKGILRNNLNIRENGGNIISDQMGPTLDDIYNFALILDEVAGVEISGFVCESPYATDKKIVRIEPYKDNSIDQSSTRMYNFDTYNVLQHFHTHGHADNYTIATTPSKLDLNFKNNKAVSSWPSIQLLILHNYGSPIKY